MRKNEPGASYAWNGVIVYSACVEVAEPPPDDPGNPTVDFHGENRHNDTHESSTDGNALMAGKGQGKEGKLGYNGSLLTENPNGLIVNTEVLQAKGRQNGTRR